jgi:hypothetical protein
MHVVFCIAGPRFDLYSIYTHLANFMTVKNLY